MPQKELKKNWSMTSEAFHNLLRWLGDGAVSEGQKYLEIRQRLANYFDRKNCLSPDELADETLNRIARRIEEEGRIESETPAKYCYITARFVFQEHLRGIEKHSISIDLIKAEKLSKKNEDEEKESKEKMLVCLEKCVGELDETSQEMIVKYYYGKERVKIENRRTLAEKLGISSNALAIRACRIRDKLEICVKKCRTQI